MIEFEDRKKEKKLKPKVVHDYNNTMGGVEKVDQHLTGYPVARKRGQFHQLDPFSLIAHPDTNGLIKSSGSKPSVIEIIKCNFETGYDEGVL
ncbi:hypothetical protein TNIN_79361 [Trichonephila inaurata madagascariensis]|uniref:Uncharacterized protein n=1 Tax=Trichonephila inaurata madagascariensis TaxID=2747483 RepID=A0A8X7C6H7_9ARAC|nr:hypothetical protein TNIN_79361 [Trichonephila inaurata madagascariensis]